MTVATHCLPNGALGPDELPVCVVAPGASLLLTNPSGARRGVVVAMHGLSISVEPTPPVFPTSNGTTPGFEDYSYQLYNALLADDWAILQVAYPEDFYSAGPGAYGIQADIENDSGNGSRYAAMTKRWWIGHVEPYCDEHIAAGIPLVPYGVSWGAWHTLLLASASNPAASIVGYACHVPACILQNAVGAFTDSLFQGINCDGVIIEPNALNAVRVPGIISYGTQDEAVGWAATTYTGSAVNVATLTGTQSLAVASTAHLTNGPAVRVTGLTGGTSGGEAVIDFTLGSGTLTDCKTVYGSGTLEPGTAVVQNYTDELITTAQAAGSPVTRNATADFHELTSSTATEIYDWFVSTLDPHYPPAF